MIKVIIIPAAAFVVWLGFSAILLNDGMNTCLQQHFIETCYNALGR